MFRSLGLLFAMSLAGCGAPNPIAKPLAGVPEAQKLAAKPLVAQTEAALPASIAVPESTIAEIPAAPYLSSETTLETLADAKAQRAPKISAGNRMRLHVDGAEAFPALRDLIRTASRSLDFESFGFADDSEGLDIARMLADRHKEGLAVRVIVDGYKAPGLAVYFQWSAYTSGRATQ